MGGKSKGGERRREVGEGENRERKGKKGRGRELEIISPVPNMPLHHWRGLQFHHHHHRPVLSSRRIGTEQNIMLCWCLSQ